MPLGSCPSHASCPSCHPRPFSAVPPYPRVTAPLVGHDPSPPCDNSFKSSPYRLALVALLSPCRTPAGGRLSRISGGPLVRRGRVGHSARSRRRGPSCPRRVRDESSSIASRLVYLSSRTRRGPSCRRRSRTRKREEGALPATARSEVPYLSRTSRTWTRGWEEGARPGREKRSGLCVCGGGVCACRSAGGTSSSSSSATSSTSFARR